ncbi:DNA repair protein RAD51 homolog 4 isoform X3 [Typha latifolia]|uniref:DNA repair protein RAD51 homolog 4 isoform X3 n=1 Tax=Typha latifolia TaxID=4733 RepID=UPI003C2F6FBB
MMEDDELSTGKEGVKEFTQAVTVMDNWHQRWLTGVELLQDINENKHLLPTGFEGLDRLLGGGLRQGQLTEIAGPSSSGKTQVCLYSASHIADKHLGVVMFLDTCNSFSPNRIACIVNQLPTSLVKDVNIGGGKICLLIIDSISSLIGPTLGGKSSEGRFLMVSVGIILKRLANDYNLSVLVTNHMVSGEGGLLKPALGESWKTIPHIRLVISRDQGSNFCTATILKHTLMASGHTSKIVIHN